MIYLLQRSDYAESKTVHIVEAPDGIDFEKLIKEWVLEKLGVLHTKLTIASFLEEKGYKRLPFKEAEIFPL